MVYPGARLPSDAVAHGCHTLAKLLAATGQMSKAEAKLKLDKKEYKEWAKKAEKAAEQGGASCPPEDWVALLTTTISCCADFTARDLSKVFWATGKLAAVMQAASGGDGTDGVEQSANNHHGSVHLVDPGEVPAAVAAAAAAAAALSGKHKRKTSSESKKKAAKSNATWAEDAEEGGGGSAVDMTSASPAATMALLVVELDKAAAIKAHAFDARGVSTVLYGYATLGVRPTCSQALVDKVNSIAPYMNPQDVANALWAVGKLHITQEGGNLAGLHAQAAKFATQFRPLEFAMVMWSLATIGGERDPDPLDALLQAVANMLDGAASTAQGVVNITWACAKLCATDSETGNPFARDQLGIGTESKFAWLPSVEAEMKRVRHSLTTQGLATAAWSLARLGCSAAAVHDLVLSRTKLLQSMAGSDLSDVCSALAYCGTGPKSAELLETVRGCASAMKDDAPWQMYGHLLHLYHAAEMNAGPGSAEIPAAATAACLQATKASILHRTKISAAVRAEIKGLLPSTAKNAADRRLLMVNHFEDQLGIEEVVKGQYGWKVKRWSRNATDDTPGRVLPKTGKPSAACLARLPATKAAAEMMVDMITGLIQASGKSCELWVAGTATEGIRSLHAYAMKLPGVKEIALVRSKEYHPLWYLQVKVPPAHASGAGAAAGAGDLATAVKAEKAASNAHPARQGRAEAVALKRWRIMGNIELENKPSFKWWSFPGLFSGGGLDVMTAELLRAVPKPPQNARVLDYGAGSGVIGAALRLREDTVDLHLLDSDALALEAAAKNLPGSSRYCGTSLACVPGQFDWIVSNPPVHVELMTDFDSLRDLLATAPGRLKPGGKLYLVAQQYVPVPHVSEAASKLGLSILVTTGRFTVWQWTAPATNRKDRVVEEASEGGAASSSGNSRKEKRRERAALHRKKQKEVGSGSSSSSGGGSGSSGGSSSSGGGKKRVFDTSNWDPGFKEKKKKRTESVAATADAGAGSGAAAAKKPKRDKTRFTSKGRPVFIKARDTVGKIGFE